MHPDTRVPEQMSLGERVDRYYKVHVTLAMATFIVIICLFVATFLILYGLWYAKYEKKVYEKKQGRIEEYRKLHTAKDVGIDYEVTAEPKVKELKYEGF